MVVQRKHSKLSLVSLLALVMMFCSATASANMQIPDNSRLLASAAYDPVNDRYLIVYEKSLGNDRSIYARFIGADGEYLAPEFAVSAQPGTTENNPSVAYDVNAEKFLAIWSDYRNYNWDVYGQFIDAGNVSGLLYKNAFAIADSASEHSVGAALAYDETTTRFLVAWSGLSGYPGGNLISGQFVNSASNPSYLFSVNFPLSTVDSTKYTVAVANDAANDRFMAVWEDRRSGIDIYGQIVDSASGSGYLFSTDASTNLPIATGASSSFDPEVAYNASTGRFMVVWSDSRDANLNIYGQLIDAATGGPVGTALDTNFPVSTAPNMQREAALTAGPGDSHLVVFRSSNGPGFGILGQLMDGSGNAVATSIEVNYPVAEGSEFYMRPGIVYNAYRDNYLFHYDNESVSPYEVVLLVDPPREDPGGGGGGGGGGCNTVGPAGPPWMGLVWIAMLGGMIAWRRRREQG